MSDVAVLKNLLNPTSKTLKKPKQPPKFTSHIKN